MQLKQGVLIFACAVICTIALGYGLSPRWFFDTFLIDPQDPSRDQTHILRALMMLYITLGLFWLYSAFSDKYRDGGILLLGLFCTGLVAGRVLSLIVDGIPSPILIVYTIMELSLVPLCLWLLRRDKG